MSICAPLRTLFTTGAQRMANPPHHHLYRWGGGVVRKWVVGGEKGGNFAHPEKQGAQMQMQMQMPKASQKYKVGKAGNAGRKGRCSAGPVNTGL